MKIVLSLIFIVFVSQISYAQSGTISGLQEKYRDRPNSFSLTLEGDLVKALAGLTNASNDLKEARLSEALQFLRIIVVNGEAEALSSRDLKKLASEIKRRSLEEVMSVKSAEGDIKVLLKESDRKVRDLLMLVQGLGGFAAIDFSGNLPE